MAHGTPDWWGTEPTTTVHKVSDLGELAARLGSIVTFDRRGDVVWLEDFESGLTHHWANTFPGTSAILLSSAYSRNGAYSAKLQTGAVSGDKAGIYRYFQVPAPRKIGVECSFSLDSHVSAIEVWAEYFDGTHYHRFAVKYLPGSDKWQYRNSGGTYSDLLTAIVYPINPMIFQTVKLVFDLDSDEYARFIANEQAEPMAGIAGQSDTSDTPASLYAHVEILTDDANVAIAYVDDFILTQNEP